jgi:hypothetical protein
VKRSATTGTRQAEAERSGQERENLDTGGSPPQPLPDRGVWAIPGGWVCACIRILPFGFDAVFPE